MASKQQKDGTWRVVKKDGTLGKTKFKTQKAAQARSRGNPGKGKGTGSKKGGKKTGTAVAKKGDSTPAKPPKIGASYSYGKATAMIASPLTDEALEGGTPEGVLRRAGKKAWSIPYAYNLGVVAADEVIDKKTAHKQALTGGSVSAWAPEAFLVGVAVSSAGTRADPKEKAKVIHRDVVIAHQGYNPRANKIAWADDRFRTYRLIRHGGQILRRLKNRVGLVGRIIRPIERAVKALGGRA